ncbi:hypothetical protein K431DRAFT_287316 [Polychaeton citri CBS 116435]|uniref:Uncharacterized protein n=1 Tax=Polychaeton citri CBS 116435 TaxID=1314669 RepID=A0A9P4UKB3_9PEZI|nr:hypothetical protein K431DRAFT_287316 [Polychaeton citri CBS 116435]
MSKLELDDTLKRIDILLNRQNVALARSQRLIQSWLPKHDDPEKSTTSVEPGHPQDDNEDEFRGMSELAGIGAVVRDDDDGQIGGLRRKKVPSNDKLLEQLLGKKAANAHRKRQDAGRSTLSAKSQGQGSSQGMLPQAPRGRQGGESDEDEEGGRTTSFKSKKAPHAVKSAPTMIREDDDAAAVAEDPDMAVAPKRKASRSLSQSEEEVKPAKKKHGSYLDELLAQKARKKKKKKA